MSRYWVFTEEQLDEAIRTWLHLDGDISTGERIADITIREFLNSSICQHAGMARDIAAPVAPEVRVFPAAGETESIHKGGTHENAE